MHVSIAMVRVLADMVERAGGNRDAFLEQAGVEQGWLEDSSLRLPALHYERAIDAALAVSGDPAFGLHMGEQVRSVMFDVMGPLAEHAGTLREMFESMERYSRLLSAGPAPELHEAGASAWIRFPFLRGDVVAFRVSAEFAMTALLRALTAFMGDRARPLRVSFAFPAPPYAAEYARIFGGAERFGEPHTQLELPRAWLDKPQSYANVELYAALKAQADRTLDRLDRESLLSARIGQALVGLGSRGSTVEDVARALDMSPRSLRRRLRAEGLSFVELRTRYRVDQARRLLNQPRSSIQETAFALGFDSVSAFHRAFKRWTGTTPMQYRKSS